MTTTPPTPPTPPERSVIVNCLMGIRRRLWIVRLSERVTLGVEWGAVISLLLIGCRLLREPLPWENLPWMGLLMGLLPLGAAAWLFRAAPRLGKLNLTPALVRVAAVLTAVLSVAMIVLVLHPLGRQVPVWMVPAATIAAFVIMSAASVRMVNLRSAAIYVDQQVGLHERVSTALEMLEAPAASTLVAAFRAPVIASALGACQEVRTAKVGYSRLDSRLYAFAALVAIAAASLTLIPPMPARAVPIRKPNTILVQQSKNLHEILKDLEEKKLPNDKITLEKLKSLQNAINQLQQGNMSPIESSAVLNEAKEQMKREQEAMAASDKVQDMLKTMSQTQDFAKAADQMKDAQMQQAQGDAGTAQQAAAEALKGAADALADKMKSGQMSEAEKKALGDKLQAAADKASADPQLQKDLQSAADAVKSGDANKLSSAMQSAGQRMGQQSAGGQMSQSALNRAMSEIDRMQNGGAGSQSTMGQGGGQNGSQSGNQGNGEGNGNQANGGQGAGQQPGKGTGDAPAGGQPGGGLSSKDGTTMLENRGGPDGHHEGDIGGKESFVRIYDSTSIPTEGSQEKVGSYINPLNGPANGSMDVMGSADDKNSQIKAYSDVLPEARQQAMDELTRQEYPPQYQEMVRQFYGEAPKAAPQPK